MTKNINRINGKPLTKSDVEFLKNINPDYKNKFYDHFKNVWFNGKVVKQKKQKKAKIEVEKEIKIKRKRKTRTKTNEELKTSVIKRDGYRCAECGCMINLEVHHIEYKSKGGKDTLENLITLCIYCHYEQHKNEPIAKLMLNKMKHKGLL
jgi:5-methylcytosine-specific restriction endonuclease McrA